MAVWHVVLPELLLQAASFLLRSSSVASLNDIQLLWRLSAVCVDWHGMVYRDESSAGRVDFWARLGMVSVERCHWQHKTGEREFELLSKPYPARAVSEALGSLRHAHLLSVHFGHGRTLQNISPILTPLQHFSHLIYLDLDLRNAWSVKQGSRSLARAASALSNTLAAIASRNRSLTALRLDCAYLTPDYDLPGEVVQPSVDALRLICSSVKHLSMSAPELLLMVWGTNSIPESARAWQAQSVQSFALPTLHIPGYLTSDIVTTLAATLTSLTHLHVQSEQDTAHVSALLQHFGGRLTFFRVPAVSLQLSPSVALSCTALVSLYINDERTWTKLGESIQSSLACLASCPSVE